MFPRAAACAAVDRRGGSVGVNSDHAQYQQGGAKGSDGDGPRHVGQLHQRWRRFFRPVGAVGSVHIAESGSHGPIRRDRRRGRAVPPVSRARPSAASWLRPLSTAARRMSTARAGPFRAPTGPGRRFDPPDPEEVDKEGSGFFRGLKISGRSGAKLRDHTHTAQVRAARSPSRSTRTSRR